MKREHVCRQCLLWESGREDILQSVRAHIEKIPPRDKCGEETYNARLSQCKACDDLVGGTCLKCGCYPEFRAAFRTQRCPKKNW